MSRIKLLMVPVLACAALVGLSGCVAYPVYGGGGYYGPTAAVVVPAPVYRPYYGGGYYGGGYYGGGWGRGHWR